jgi:hypothetical protein
MSARARFRVACASRPRTPTTARDCAALVEAQARQQRLRRAHALVAADLAVRACRWATVSRRRVLGLGERDVRSTSRSSTSPYDHDSSAGWGSAGVAWATCEIHPPGGSDTRRNRRAARRVPAQRGSDLPLPSGPPGPPSWRVARSSMASFEEDAGAAAAAVMAEMRSTEGIRPQGAGVLERQIGPLSYLRNPT